MKNELKQLLIFIEGLNLQQEEGGKTNKKKTPKQHFNGEKKI